MFRQWVRCIKNIKGNIRQDLRTGRQRRRRRGGSRHPQVWCVRHPVPVYPPPTMTDMEKENSFLEYLFRTDWSQLTTFIRTCWRSTARRCWNILGMFKNTGCWRLRKISTLDVAATPDHGIHTYTHYSVNITNKTRPGQTRQTKEHK